MRLATLLLAAALALPATAKTVKLSFVGADAINPIALLPAPPADDSLQTREELKTLHQIAQDATAAEKSAARADSKNETVFLLAPAVGADFSAANYPATAALFAKIQDDGDYFEKISKKIFMRPRPYVLDGSLVPACRPRKKPSYSYPSGHAIEAWTQATVLAALLPAKATAILARAEQFAFEREVCGVHYPSDVEAGHVLGLTLGKAILASPDFATAAAAARQELAKVK